jgi:hypothetical protein
MTPEDFRPLLFQLDPDSQFALMYLYSIHNRFCCAPTENRGARIQFSHLKLEVSQPKLYGVRLIARP